MPLLLDQPPATMPSPMAGAPGVVTEERDPEAEQAKVVTFVMERMTVSERFDRSFKDAALRHWEYLFNILPDDWPYFSRFFEPETSTTSNDVIEGLMSAVFNKERPFDLIPVEVDDELQTELFRLLMDFTLREKTKYKLNTYYQVQESVFFGNGVLKHTIQPRSWVERRRVPVFGGDMQPTVLGMRDVQEQKYEVWPVTRPISRFDCFPAATGGTIQEMPYFIERLILPLDRIKAIGAWAGWQNTEKLTGFMALDRSEGNVWGQWSEATYDIYQRFAAIGYDTREGTPGDGGQNAVKYGELLIYSEAPPDRDGGGRIIVIGDRKHQLKLTPENPYHHGLKCYSEIKFEPRGAQYWQARGVPEKIEPMQVALNVRMSQIGDIIEEARSPMLLVGDGAGVEDLTDLDPYPRARVRVSDVNEIKSLDRQPVPPDIWSDVMQRRAAIQRVGGSTDYSKGVAGATSGLSRGTETATGMSLLINAANAAKSFKWRLAEETGITDGLNMIAALIQQFMDTPQKVRILGENRVLQDAGFKEVVEVRPEDISGRWNFFAVGASSSIDNATQAEIMTRIVTGGMELPEVRARLKQLDAWVEGSENSGMRNPRRLLRSEEEMAQLEEQGGGEAAQQAAAMEAQKQLELIKSLDYKDAPPDIKMQLEAMAGLQPSQLHQIVAYLQSMIDAQPAPPGQPARAKAGGGKR